MCGRLESCCNDAAHLEYLCKGRIFVDSMGEEILIEGQQFMAC